MSLFIAWLLYSVTKFTLVLNQINVNYIFYISYRNFRAQLLFKYVTKHHFNDNIKPNASRVTWWLKLYCEFIPITEMGHCQSLFRRFVADP
jgi:hypothetical protein